MREVISELIGTFLTVILFASLFAFFNMSSVPQMRALPAELLVNSDFEKDESAVSWWTYDSVGGANFRFVSGLNHYVRVDTPNGYNGSSCWAQSVNNKVGRAFNFSFSAMANFALNGSFGADGGVAVAIEQYQSNVYLGALDSAHYTTSSDGWIKIKVSGELLPGCDRISAVMMIKNIAGYVMFDNTSFCCVGNL